MKAYIINIGSINHRQQFIAFNFRSEPYFTLYYTQIMLTLIYFVSIYTHHSRIHSPELRSCQLLLIGNRSIQRKSVASVSTCCCGMGYLGSSLGGVDYYSVILPSCYHLENYKSDRLLYTKKIQESNKLYDIPSNIFY